MALRTRAADAPARRVRRRLPRVGAPLPRADRGGGAARQAIVFIHGVGVGPGPYVDLLRQLAAPTTPEEARRGAVRSRAAAGCSLYGVWLKRCPFCHSSCSPARIRTVPTGRSKALSSPEIYVPWRYSSCASRHRVCRALHCHAVHGTTASVSKPLLLQTGFVWSASTPVRPPQPPIPAKLPRWCSVTTPCTCGYMILVNTPPHDDAKYFG